jgi:hypothetical protein
MTIRESEERLSFLTEEGERKLVGIRQAMQHGDRVLAVKLAAERYQLLKEMEDIKKTSADKEKRTRKVA